VLGFQVKTSAPAVDQTLVLSDGRTLGYALWGEPGGTPVLLVGTSPGSRLLCPDLPATVAAGVRLVTVDRPGSGRSDPDPHPGMARWVADTGALVDHLRLERLGLVGWSGGGQFALAAAAGLPDRVTSVHGGYYAQRLPHASEVYTRAADHLLAIPLWGDILGSLALPQGR
jgi:pimeloyl-ACP methyl ester carboxylesterase